LFLINTHRKQLAVLYVLCFALTYGWLAVNGLLLSQFNPVFFINHLDLTRNMLFLPDVQHAVIRNLTVRISLDLLFISTPLGFLVACLYNSRWQYAVAVLLTGVNFVYCMLLTSMTMLSIEGFIAWMLVPLVFTVSVPSTFYYMVKLMRYFFLLIFFSAGCWKLRAGGFFNSEQMSGILLRQHAAYLYSAPGAWYSRFIEWLIVHQNISRSIYLVAGFIELFFIVGFVTKKFDRLLIGLFLLFLILNYFVMGINYASWTIFIFCAWYARYPLQKDIADAPKPAY